MVSETPNGWTVAPLGEVCGINPRHPREVPEATRVSFVPMPALSEDDWHLALDQERALSKVRTGHTHFAENDVLFAKITPCMENGKAAVARGLRNGLGCGTTELHVLRPSADVEPEYIYHFVHQESFRRSAAQSFTGTAGQLRVPVAFVSEAPLPLPPFPEQRRIVAKLDQLLSNVNSCRKRLERVPLLLKRFRQAVLAAACSGRLTEDWREQNPSTGAPRVGQGTETIAELPLSWRAATVGEVCRDSYYGPRFGRNEYVADGVPTVRTTDMTETGAIRLKDAPRVRVDSEQLERFRLRSGDLLITRTGSIGTMAVFRGTYTAIPSAYLIRFRLTDRVVPEYIFYQLKSPRGQQDMGLGVTAVTQPNINAETIKAIRIGLPALSEQQEIVNRVTHLFSLADSIERRYATAKAAVDKLTQSILAKAFRGELVPQDPNDEPAEKLLERIRAERGKAQARAPQSGRLHGRGKGA